LAISSSWNNPLSLCGVSQDLMHQFTAVARHTSLLKSVPSEILVQARRETTWDPCTAKFITTLRRSPALEPEQNGLSPINVRVHPKTCRRGEVLQCLARSRVRFMWTDPLLIGMRGGFLPAVWSLLTRGRSQDEKYRGVNIMESRPTQVNLNSNLEGR
jgi:hypothetical protein